jgi:hypothetical protein
MLREILALLASGGTQRLDELARSLGTQAPMIEDILVRLCALGYVEELSGALASSCSDGGGKSCAGCAGCGFISGCGQAPKSRVWALTDKGREFSRAAV